MNRIPRAIVVSPRRPVDRLRILGIVSSLVTVSTSVVAANLRDSGTLINLVAVVVGMGSLAFWLFIWPRRLR